MSFRPTEEQQKAIDANGSVLVSAAAGSGKTAVLSNRVIKLITDDKNPFDISDLLVLTFTKAAAAEMKERISRLLSEIAEKNPDDRHVLRQKISVDTAAIGTTDSFCSKLIRDNFEKAGVNPDFKIASTEQSDMIVNDCTASVLAELAENDSKRYESLMSFMNAENATTAIEVIKTIYKFVRSTPQPGKWLDNAVGLYKQDSALYAELMQYVYAQIADKADYWKTTSRTVIDRLNEDDAIRSKYGDTVAFAYEYMSTVSTLAAEHNYDELHKYVTQSELPSHGRMSGEYDKSLCEQVKAVCASADGIMKEITPLVSMNADDLRQSMRESGNQIETIADLVRRMHEKSLSVKNERNIMNFTDIEYAALKLLCEEKNGQLVIRESAKDICSRYKEVMVDEYQDTNDLQNAIYNAISGNGERLFLVGDVKQSIYRFRHANPKNFIEKKLNFPEYDGEHYPSKITLSGNFRSRPEICDFVNFTFRLLMSKKSAKMDYLPEDELDPKGVFPETDEPPVEVRIVPLGKKESSVSVQARATARYIKEKVDGGMSVSDGSGGLRPAKYSDFIILFRSKKPMPEFMAELRKLGISSTAETSGNFFSETETEMVMSLLRAIDNPLRDIHLLSAMMNPAFGFTPDEVAEIRMFNSDRNDGRNSGSTARPLYFNLVRYSRSHEAFAEKAAEFIERLEMYRSWAGTLPVDRLISKIYNDTGLTAVVSSMNDGASKYANLLLLSEYAANYESFGYKGLTAFLRYVDNICKSADGVKCASAVGSDDAVRIMTIHKSKGLQAPVCIMPMLDARFNTDYLTKTFILSEKYGIGIKTCSDSRYTRIKTAAYSAMCLEEREELIAENMRLLYVAMTRAQDKLMMMFGDGDIEKSVGSAAVKLNDWSANGDSLDSVSIISSSGFSKWLYMCLMLHRSCGELRAMSDAAFNCSLSKYPIHLCMDAPPTDGDAESCGEDIDEQNESIDLSDILDYRYPYEKLLNIESKYSVSALAKSVRKSENCCSSRPAFITGDSMTAAEKGTATHRFMCYADYNEAVKSVENEADRLVSQGYLTSEQAEAIDTEAVSKFFESRVYERIKSADRVLRESRFICEMPVNRIDPTVDSDETVVVQGVADCVIFEPDGITVVDFKTDRNTTEDALIKKYTEQLQIYAHAFSLNYDMPAKECILYSFSLRRSINTPL